MPDARDTFRRCATDYYCRHIVKAIRLGWAWNYCWLRLRCYADMFGCYDDITAIIADKRRVVTKATPARH